MWIFFIACPLPVIVRRICLFENFEKLSLLLGFLRYIGRVGEGLLHARISSFNQITARSRHQTIVTDVRESNSTYFGGGGASMPLTLP